jgi:peptidyl-prolyl cis-trans isomerase C
MNAVRSIVIEGVEIPEALIAREAQNHPGPDGASAWNAAARALALKALLLDRARELGLDPAAEHDEAGREETREEALMRAVLDAEVNIAAPTAEECRRVYEANLARFRAPDLYEASHILIEPAGPEEADSAAARASAERLIAELRAAPSRFGEAARQFSACQSGALGGSLGQLQGGDLLPEIEAALLALAAGEIGPAPVRSHFGWHIVRLDRRIEGKTAPFEHVADTIAAQLQGRAWVGAAARYTADLAQRARQRGVTLSLSDEGDLSEGPLALGALLTPRAAALLPAWLESADPDLKAAVDRARGSDEVSAFVRRAVSAFVETATDEQWTQLISAAQGAEDPALAALAAILKQKLLPRPRATTLINRR